jgi:leukotriene-A4 hydrolase
MNHHHAQDLSSLSNPHEVSVSHMDWEALVDFESKVLLAKVTYKLQVNSPGADRLCLDTSSLEIHSIINETGHTLPYKLHPVTKPHLGSLLEIQLPPGTTSVSIDYATTPQSSALQWLPPAQTAGKVRPYLFNQSQAIHARSIFPCQDRPGVKTTYRAKVTVPDWANVVMSALLQSTEPAENDTKCFSFHQPVPVSAYLICLAVGDLVKKDLDQQTAIYSEPCVLEAAAWEFAQTPEFLQIAEDIAGMPYVWTRYDVLCLPGSYPFGGMEYPCITFVTPTLLAGDRSLADVVAHEISHSWTGNLVANASWEHFWLNEGWTTWFQRKIMARIHKNSKFVDFDAIGGYKSLQEAVTLMPEKFTSLVPILGDTDPDDYYSTVPYEKGFNLLYYLENKVGTPAFEQFFQAYLKEFAYKILTSEDFQDFFMAYFNDRKKDIQDVDWKAWFHSPGMPPEEPYFDKSLSQSSELLAEQWLAVDTRGGMLPSSDISMWTSKQITCFLDALQGHPFSLATIQAMNKMYKFSASRNSEILFRYCQLALAAHDISILPVVVRFVTTQGRMKFTRPLYRSLNNMNRELAVSTFFKNFDLYHPICAKMVASDLKVEENKSTTIASVISVLTVAAVVSVCVILMTRITSSKGR